MRSERIQESYAPAAYSALVTKNRPDEGLYQQASVSPSINGIGFVNTAITIDRRNNVITKTVQTEYPATGTLRVDQYTTNGSTKGR